MNTNPEKEQVKLSIIIVTYKSNDLIYDCIESIFNNDDTNKNFEIIIVDNSPDDYKPPLEYYYNYPEIRFVKNIKNTGYGDANNIGVKLAFGEYILICNPDVRFVEPIFKYTIQLYENNELISIIGPKEVDEDNIPALSYFYRMEYTNIFRRVILQKLFNQLDIFLQSKMYFNGACFFIRKDHFNLAGGFDKDIFLYSEEPDLITRIENLNSNYKCFYLRDKRVVHLKKIDSQSLETLKQSVISAVYYLKKYNFNTKKYLKNRIDYSKLKRWYLKIKGNEKEHIIYDSLIKFMINLSKEIKAQKQLK